MSRGLGTLVLDIVAKTGSFTAPLDKANREMQRTSKDIQRSLRDMQSQMDSAKRTLTGLVGALGVGLSAKAFKDWTKGAVDAAEATKFFADRIGLSVEELTKMQYVAGQFGVTTDQLNVAMQRYQRRAGEAANGFGIAANAFKKLNLEAKEIIKLPIDEQFKKISASLATIQDHGLRMNIIKDLFDTGGMPLINMLRQSGEEFDALIQQAEKLGYVTSNEFAEMAADVNGQMAVIKGAFANVGQSIAAEFLPKIHEFVMAITDDDIARWVDNFKSSLESAAKVLKVVGVIFAGRFVASITASAVAFARSAQEAVKNTVALRQQAVAAGAVATSTDLAAKMSAKYAAVVAAMKAPLDMVIVRQYAAATAARAMSAAMAVMGGPVGLAVTGLTIAISALSGSFLGLGGDVDETRKSLLELGDTLDDITTKFNELSTIEQRRYIDDALKNVSELRAEQETLHKDIIKNIGKEYDAVFGKSRSAQRGKGGFLNQFRTELNNAVKHTGDFTKALDVAQEKLGMSDAQMAPLTAMIDEWRKLDEQINETSDTVEALRNQTEQTSKDVVDSVEQISAEYAKQKASIEERIALIGTEGEAARFKYRMEQGLIKDMTDAEQVRLLQLYEIYDATMAEARAQKELARSAEQAQASIDSTLESLRDRVALLGKSRAEQVAYDLQKKGASQKQIDEAVALITQEENFNKKKRSGVKIQKQTNKALTDYQNLVKQLQTDEERRLETLRNQLDIIQKSGASAAEQADMARRAAELAMGDMEMPNLGVIGGDQPLTQQDRLRVAEQELNDWYKKQLEMLDEFRIQKAELSEIWDEREAEVKQAHEDKLAQIERARQEAAKEGLDGFFDDLKSLRESDNVHARNIAKAAAITQIAIKIPENAQNAATAASAVPVVGHILGPIAAAAAVAAGMARIQQIRGMAHEGIDAIPQTGTWLLEKGERVTTAKTSARIDKVLDDIRSGQVGGVRGGNGSAINQTIHVDGRIDNYTANQIARQSAKRQQIAQARFGSGYR